MRRHAVLITLAALEALAVALLGLFWFVMRPEVLVAYGLDPKHADWHFEWTLPRQTQVAFSGWFILQAVVIGALLVLLACSPLFRTRARTFLAGAGLVWTVFGLAFAIWATYAPMFARLDY